MSDASLVPVAAPPALASADDDDEDEDLKAGASVVETQFSQRAWAGTAAIPWQPCREGSWDDLLVLLAVTALPSAVVWITPSARYPLTKVMEWNKGVCPLPSAAPLAPVPPQVTRSLSVECAPVLINAEGETITDAAWLINYAKTHPEWNVAMVRKGADDGFLSFAAVVNSEMGTPPMSLADERTLESNAVAASASETTQDAAAAAQAAAAAAATTREAATSALRQQKDALDATFTPGKWRRSLHHDVKITSS